MALLNMVVKKILDVTVAGNQVTDMDNLTEPARVDNGR